MKTSADTMAAEKTLTRLELGGCGCTSEWNAGCCECEDDCGRRNCEFGNAIGCAKQMACSTWCPRLMEMAVPQNRNGEAMNRRNGDDLGINMDYQI